MARIRTIKPSHVNDKELSKISLQAHLFWVLSWCFSDDEGVIENDPLLLKSQLFPRRTDIRTDQVQQWIDQLVKARFMIPFTHNGECYLLHRTFKVHQKIDRPQPSKIPFDTIRRIIDEHSTNDQPCIVKESKGEVEDSKGGADARFEKKLILEIPFTDKFLESWVMWKEYKKNEFRFLFKSIQSEQAAINELVSLSQGLEQTAIEIIHQSMAKGWKGLFTIKENEQSNPKTTKPGASKITGSQLNEALAKFRGQGKQPANTG